MWLSDLLFVGLGSAWDEHSLQRWLNWGPPPTSRNTEGASRPAYHSCPDSNSKNHKIPACSARPNLSGMLSCWLVRGDSLPGLCLPNQSRQPLKYTEVEWVELWIQTACIEITQHPKPPWTLKKSLGPHWLSLEEVNPNPCLPRSLWKSDEVCKVWQSWITWLVNVQSVPLSPAPLPLWVPAKCFCTGYGVVSYRSGN